MAEQIEVPAIGKVDRKYVYGAVALVAGIVGYAWWTRSRSEAAVVTTDPTTGSEDPATGGAYVNPRPVTSTVDQTGDAIDTNPEWTAAVTARLSTMFYDSQFIATTLGKYLSRQPLTTDEADLVRTAWAFEGKPPEGPDSFTLTNTGGNSSIPETYAAQAGQHLSAWVAAVNAAYPAAEMTEAKAKLLNPGAPIQLANAYGYITAANPANRPGGGTPVDVFGDSYPMRIR